jgi:hypothetical protein
MKKSQFSPWMNESESGIIWTPELLNKEIQKRRRFKLYAVMAYLLLIAIFGMIVAISIIKCQGPLNIYSGF